MLPPRPYVLLSCATSADGYLDDASPRRLILSGPADLARVDEVRASCDAILVGAETIRRDDPRLLIRDPSLQAARAARGKPPHPARLTLTATGDLDLHGQHIAEGDAVVMFYASANRDEEVFEDPFTFRIDRHPNPHLGFGVGEHFCLGSVLARTQLTVLLSELLDADVSLVPAGEPRRVASIAVNGPQTLPVTVIRHR